MGLILKNYKLYWMAALPGSGVAQRDPPGALLALRHVVALVLFQFGELPGRLVVAFEDVVLHLRPPVCFLTDTHQMRCLAV